MLHSVSSERASETNNFGQKLRDGANINRSLLALANCINALGKQNKKGLAYVPYRNRYVSIVDFTLQDPFLIYVVANSSYLQQINSNSKGWAVW